MYYIVRKNGNRGHRRSRGTFTSKPELRVVGAGAGAVAIDDEGNITESALLISEVPGMQTVPRAEAWALYCVLITWHGRMNLTVVVDATYVTNGMITGNRITFLEGVNADIWKLIYARYDELEIVPRIVKSNHMRKPFILDTDAIL